MPVISAALAASRTVPLVPLRSSPAAAASLTAPRFLSGLLALRPWGRLPLWPGAELRPSQFSGCPLRCLLGVAALRGGVFGLPASAPCLASPLSPSCSSGPCCIHYDQIALSAPLQ